MCCKDMFISVPELSFSIFSDSLRGGRRQHGLSLPGHLWYKEVPIGAQRWVCGLHFLFASFMSPVSVLHATGEMRLFLLFSHEKFTFMTASPPPLALSSLQDCLQSILPKEMSMPGYP